MGLTLEFDLGDTEAIRKAVEDFDVEKLDDPTIFKGRADMSLHITPHDLDALSQEFASASGHEPIELGPYLEGLFDDPERGALAVDGFWVSYAADVPKSEVRHVTERWVTRMSKEYNDPQLAVTDAAVQAVEGLVALCARAKAEGLTMVHVWFL
jgi:hypothetical protein